VTGIDLKDLVFLDEMGVLLGLMRTHARAAPGERTYAIKPFYRGSKVSVIGAISVSKVLAVMTIDDSMDAAAFKVYVSKFLVPQLWKGAVVVMDNLAAHKVEAIAPLIEAVGARVLYMSPYSPEFNPIEHWWSQLKAFLRQFSPTTSQRVDMLIKIAMNLMNPSHLHNCLPTAATVPHKTENCCIYLKRGLVQGKLKHSLAVWRVYSAMESIRAVFYC
jgi:transposase